VTRTGASRVALAGLLAANLFVALVALRFRWGYYDVMLLAWVEAIILGFYNVLRMIVVGLAGAEAFGASVEERVDLGGPLNRLLLTLLGVGFFVVTFGGFALFIGLFVLLLPAMLLSDGATAARTIQHALSGPGLAFAAAILWLSHGLSFVRNFLAGREYERTNLLVLVVWPYARMSFVAALLTGGFIVARLFPEAGRETAFAVTMVLLKLGADLIGHLMERNTFRREAVRPPPIPQTAA